MKRKQVTYAYKRNRTRRILLMNSSPGLPDVEDVNDDLDHQLTRTQMVKRMLKRSRYSGSTISTQISKKSRLSLHEDSTQCTHPSRPPFDLQTPNPTLLTEAQVFQLESSVGQVLPPGYEFSPVPAQAFRPLPLRRTSSQSLKENAVAPPSRSSSLSKYRVSTNDDGPLGISKRPTDSSSRIQNRLSLASPFTSQPSSPQMKNDANTTISSSKRALSDIKYSSNIPGQRNQTQSTFNSPTYEDMETAISRARRPSAPCSTAVRPDISLTFNSSKANFRNESVSFFPSFDPSDYFVPKLIVDFNRPPSQLSYTSAYNENFFDDAIDFSTPFLNSGVRRRRRAVFDSPCSTDEEVDYPPRIRPAPYFDRDATNGTAFDDSLFSSLLGAYSKEETISLGLGNLDIGPAIDGTSTSSCGGPVFEVEENLETLINSLEIECEETNISPTSRTGSSSGEQHPSGAETAQGSASGLPSQIRHPAVESTDKHKGRDRRGSIKASDSRGPVSGPLPLAGGARRTRSGTVVQTSSRARRERSDTIIARNSSLHCSVPETEPASEATAVQILHAGSDLEVQRDTHASAAAEDGDDELLLGGHWVEEDWAVSPPSPLRSSIVRPKGPKFKQWKKGWKPGRVTGTWGMRDHDEDDGKEDPLLLK